MPNKSDHRRSADAICRRAHELAAAGKDSQVTADAEILAAIADGVLPFDQLEDETLERCLKTFGSESVAAAFLEAAAHAQGPERQMVLETAKTLVQSARAGRTPPAGPSEDLLVALWSWLTRPGWVAGAAAIAVIAALALLVTASWKHQSGHGNTILAALQWPANPPFNPAALKPWGFRQTPLPKELPDFNSGTATLGAPGDPRYMQWRLATVIVRTAVGYGSGAIISPDGWILTNYHVVSDAAQEAAVSGHPALAEVIMAHLVNGRIKPLEPAMKAILYRVDPVHDLALLKLETLPAGGNELPFFKLGAQVEDGEDCFVIGSQANGPAWWLRSANVSQQFDFPQDLSQVAAGMANPDVVLDRDHATVIVTDARISPGDSGGPLLDDKGELIGLTFATPANLSGGSVGWHIALPHLRNFIADLPRQPEGVPFDPWTAGVPEATKLTPRLVDADGDGRIDSLCYRYAQSSDRRSDTSQQRPFAVTVFVDLEERLHSSNDPLNLLPLGIWGMEDRGGFHFNLFLTTRADGVAAVGYTNAKGVVDEIRIGHSQQTDAQLIWRRDDHGLWQATTPAAGAPLWDTTRVRQENLRLLQSIAGQIFAAPEDRRPSGREDQPPPDRGQPGVNKM